MASPAAVNKQMLTLLTEIRDELRTLNERAVLAEYEIVGAGDNVPPPDDDEKETEDGSKAKRKTR